MALNAKNAGGGQNFKKQDPIEIGVYPGRLVQIIDLGLQAQNPYQGKAKPPIQEVMYTYEFVDEFMKDEDGKDILDKPRWLSETMPFHGLFAENAKSTKRYNAFDPTGAFDGDVTKAIGLPLNVAVVHNVKGENTYDNIGSVSPMRAKDAEKCPEPQNPTKVFDLDAPDMEVFNALPKWIRDKMTSNLNYKGSVLEKAVGAQPKQAEDKPKKEEKVAESDTDDSDNNPY